ncbi:MAG TPA: hypothetical protein DCF70_03165 [Treponema sp.]|nr:hypothetical protein [Treponema sp.]
MQAIEKKPNQIAFFGTIGVWVFIFIFFSFYSLLPHNKPFKTVQIHLESPSQAKASTVNEAPPPASQAMEQAASPAAAPQSAPAQKAVEKPAPKKAEAPAKKSTQKAPPKTAAKSSKPAPRTEPKLNKTPEELLAEQLANKTKPKKTPNWDDFADFEEAASSNTGSAANAVVNQVNALEGTAASASSSKGTAQSQSSSSNKTDTGTTSSSTSSALNKIASTTYKGQAGNGVSVSATMNTAGSPDGQTSLAMNDGTARILLEPKSPVISLTPQAAATIDATREFKITFTVNADGRVPVNEIIIPKSLVSPIVQQEIANQISRWRFQSASSAGTATFIYTIKKQ